MIYTMVVEQTKQYRRRMEYIPETRSFQASEYDSLLFVRNFPYPYGWIKESGTPPQPHWDVILMADTEPALGDEVAIRVIGMFQRSDGDHKYVAVEESRVIDDLLQLTPGELEALKRLYPRVRPGEGWFGRVEAEKAMAECDKAL